MPDAWKTGWTVHDGQWTVGDMLRLLRSVPENTPISGGALVREDGVLMTVGLPQEHEETLIEWGAWRRRLMREARERG